MTCEECDNSVLFKFTDFYVRALAADGKVVTGNEIYKCGCPVDMGLDPELEAGKKAILECGGDVANIIQEPDTLTGMGLKVSLGKVNPELEKILAGNVGTIHYDSASPPCADGFTAPTLAEQANALPFEAWLYEEKREGNNIVGYYEYHLYMCQASFPALKGDQDTYSMPDWTIKCTENTQYDVSESPPGTGKPVYSWVIVAAIP